jgi:DNA-binding transcriptional regulator YhcF (GntR family)
MGKITLTNEDINNIIYLYQNKIPSTHKLAECFKVGHKKISKILKDNNIQLNSRGGQITIGNSSEIEKNKTNLYLSVDKKLIIKCKKTGIEFDDINNLSGCLTKHIIEQYGSVPIPTNTYQRKKYEKLNNKKWFEEYFDIIEGEIIIPKIKEETNKSILIKERNTLFNDKKNYVVCKLCGKKLKSISNTHLINKHNITTFDYKLKFPNEKIVSETVSDKFSKQTKITNSNMKPSWSSKSEIEVKDFIVSLGFNVEKSRNRKILDGKEIDLLIPDIKLGIEYNGLYYHTEKMGKNSSYHLNKTIACNEVGYNLIHIFEDEWVKNNELIKNKLKHILKINDGIKIGGRNVNIKLIEKYEKKEFLEKNHIQGNDNSKIMYGAYYKEELVGVMTFSNKRNMTKTKNCEYELTRYATKQNYHINGLASKFIKRFMTDYNPISIISFADRRWTLDVYNNLYTSIGFKLVDIVKPNYYYYNSSFNKYKRFHKFGFGKNALKKK